MPEPRPRHGKELRIQHTDADQAEARFVAHLTETKQVQPIVVCIRGSMRFQHEMAEAAHAESLAGRIVVMPHVNTKTWPDDVDMDQIKQGLDRLPRTKIRMAREVLVVGSYIGDSTRAEIE